MPTHGNAYQSGFPDLFCAHRQWMSRWVEIKNPVNYSFTDAQMICFPAMHAKGVGIWIITSDEDTELAKLFQPANWQQYYIAKIQGMRT